MLTEIQAINEMLATVREQPISSLTAPLPLEASLAYTFLNRAREDIQRHGWTFNTVYGKTLEIDTSGNITVGSTVHKVVFVPRSDVTPVLRGQRVYDAKNETYVFADDLETERVVSILEWDDLPDSARRYIAALASRTFEARMTGSQSSAAAALETEMKLKAEFLRDHSDDAKPNMLTGYHAQSVLGRREW